MPDYDDLHDPEDECEGAPDPDAACPSHHPVLDVHVGWLCPACGAEAPADGPPPGPKEGPTS